MLMHLATTANFGWQDSYGPEKQALMATLMAMLQHMQSVMRSLLQLVPVISVQTLEHLDQSMQVHPELRY
jgi:hypothetical protein